MAAGTIPNFGCNMRSHVLTLGELDRAEKYFETAYALARSRGYATFQIDNHFARFLLLRAIESGDHETCMASFRGARNIIENQIKDDRFHYPFRVARTYHMFYEKFESRVTPSHKEEVGRAAEYISRRIEALPNERRSQRDVAGLLPGYAKHS